MVIIVGAGLAGLACATHLEEAGADWLLLEASSGAGGRVVTEITPEGYRLDRGFQVLLDSYPTARRLLDWEALLPRYFESGALMVDDSGWERFLNPLRHPDWLLAAPLATSFSLREKITLAAYAVMQFPRSERSLAARECGRTTMEELVRLGLDGPILEKFLRPFFSGVFLDR
ncbi:MAG: FAD-dependent oxidoreductase, partial [Verrucomicrobia bacterium]|nr:FAD-dependent oxidoreductase [Verrucomicrobiota bacterium]